MQTATERAIGIAFDHDNDTSLSKSSPTLGAVIRVKNDVELLRWNLAYHAAVGVDVFVLWATGSSAASLAALEDLARRSSHVDLVRRDLYQTAVIDAETMKSIRLAAFERMAQVFSPEWIFVPDIDELWVPRSGDLKTALHGVSADYLSVARRNAALVRDSAVPVFATPAEIRRQEIIAQPITLSLEVLEENPDLPWIFHRVPPKFITRVKNPTEILPGFHDLRANEPFERESTENLLILHFPFTTLERFAQKVEDMRVHLEHVGHTFADRQAWNWRRWVRTITDAESLRAEFEKQFFSREALEDLRRRGIVRSVNEHFAASSISPRRA